MKSLFSYGFEYKATEKKEIIICGIGNCRDENLVIPRLNENGLKIVGIADEAFIRCNKIKSVSLPKSVVFIGNSAFAWCPNLERIELNSVISIDSRAFMGCDKLNQVNLGKNLSYIGEKAFAYCPNLNSIEIPKTALKIGASAFEGCRSLVKANLPESLKLIENGVFYACTSLRQINLPKKLEYIDEYAFAYCVSINYIDIPQHTVINKDAFFECGINSLNKVS